MLRNHKFLKKFLVCLLKKTGIDIFDLRKNFWSEVIPLTNNASYEVQEKCVGVESFVLAGYY